MNNDMSEKDLERFERAAEVFESRRSAKDWEEVQGPAIPSPKQTKLVSIRLPLDLYSIVLADSERQGASFSDVVRACIRGQLDRSGHDEILERVAELESRLFDRLDSLEKKVVA